MDEILVFCGISTIKYTLLLIASKMDKQKIQTKL